LPLEEPIRNHKQSVQTLMQAKGTHVPLKEKPAKSESDKVTIVVPATDPLVTNEIVIEATEDLPNQTTV
jgi:hypothetical protein